MLIITPRRWGLGVCFNRIVTIDMKPVFGRHGFLDLNRPVEQNHRIIQRDLLVQQHSEDNRVYRVREAGIDLLGVLRGVLCGVLLGVGHEGVVELVV